MGIPIPPDIALISTCDLARRELGKVGLSVYLEHRYLVKNAENRLVGGAGTVDELLAFAFGVTLGASLQAEKEGD